MNPVLAMTVGLALTALKKGMVKKKSYLYLLLYINRYIYTYISTSTHTHTHTHTFHITYLNHNTHHTHHTQTPPLTSSCPLGLAWFEYPSEKDVAHIYNYVECSNMGVCDRTAGSCTCMSGFTGDSR